ncbi:MAG TPA: hypothetical protein VF070_30345 [Streptosporangiaceae bacterium]
MRALRRLGAGAMTAIMIGAISAVAAAPASAAPTEICKGSPIPAGFVITAQGFSVFCPGNSPNNTWTITVPSTTGFTLICSVSPIPPGFVITAQDFSVFCPGNSLNNAFIIEHP